MSEVYLAKSDNGLYKIGTSKNSDRRMRDLRVAPVGITIEHVIYTDDGLRLERYLHNLYSSKRVRGEWFELDASDVKTIKSASKVMYSATNGRLSILPADHERTRPPGKGWRVELIKGINGNKYYGWRRSALGRRQFKYGGTCVKPTGSEVVHNG